MSFTPSLIAPGAALSATDAASAARLASRLLPGDPVLVLGREHAAVGDWLRQRGLIVIERERAEAGSIDPFPSRRSSDDGASFAAIWCSGAGTSPAASDIVPRIAGLRRMLRAEGPLLFSLRREAAYSRNERNEILGVLPECGFAVVSVSTLSFGQSATLEILAKAA